MKKLLITGANSYVGLSVQSYLSRWPEKYQVETLSVRGGGWKEASFRGYDAVLHAAGLVHQPQTKDDPAQAELYRQINRDLAVAVAEKAKAEGVRQFLFMSTAAVYGLTAPLGEPVTIRRETPLAPTDNYGISKLEAERALEALAGEGFKLAILRPPMIYGKGCKGNYQTLRELALRSPVFPYVENSRSMLYIGDLAELIRLLIDDEAEGVFCPQNRDYVSTCDLVDLIAHAHGKGILMVRGFTWALKLMRPLTGAVDKAFGSLRYDAALSAYPKNYQLTDLPASILETEAE